LDIFSRFSSTIRHCPHPSEEEYEHNSSSNEAEATYLQPNEAEKNELSTIIEVSREDALQEGQARASLVEGDELSPNHSPDNLTYSYTKTDNDSESSVKLDHNLAEGEISNVTTPSPTAGSALKTSTPDTSLSSKYQKLQASSSTCHINPVRLAAPTCPDCPRHPEMTRKDELLCSQRAESLPNI
jgi:hypothetical protein